MHDGVVFLDEDLVIMTWNRAAERLTGLAASSVLKKHWVPSLLQMRDERDRDIADEDCPIARALRGGTQACAADCAWQGETKRN